MPPRLSKRQQRELEEISALGSGSLANAESEEEEEETIIPKGWSGPSKVVPSAFSLLTSPNEDIGAEDEEDAGSKMSSVSKKKNKNKKKKPSAAAAALNTPTLQAGPEPPPTPQPRPQKQPKADKKGKCKAKPVDDLDQALAELSLKYSDIKPITGNIATNSALRTVLEVEPKYLDADAEMRRYFGNKVINSAEGSKAQARAPAVRSILTRPKKMWPPASMREGLSLRQLVERELPPQAKGGEKWFTVEHSTIAEVFRQQDDYSSSADTVERAIFAYEKALGGAFNVTNGACRLDFRRIENRAFFLAIHRTILHLERRGCMRTAFEFARLLWAPRTWPTIYQEHYA